MKYDSNYGTIMPGSTVKDKILINLCIFYILFPIILFYLGFLRPIAGILLTLLLLFCWFKFNRSFDFLIEKKDQSGIFNLNLKYFLICLVIVAVWVYFSGVGGFSFQNSDYIVRNAMFRDLMHYRWPVIYDLQNVETAESGYSKQVMFVYYFTFWLPAAVFGKLFGDAAGSSFLYLWAVLGIMLIIYSANRYLQKQTYTLLFVFIGFSGLDLFGDMMISIYPLDFMTHVEWWANFFQYSSNTTLLYWVFNQAIPTWLITILILNCRNPKNSAFLGSATFCYSPFATFGIIPLVLYSLIRNYERRQTIIQKLKQIITPQNVLFPLAILIIYGSFYKLNESGLNVYGFVFSKSIINPDSRFKELIPVQSLIVIIAIFLIFEVIIYFFLLWKEIRIERNGFLLLAVAELLLIPFYYMSLSNDFVMRASIPALFVLMIFLTRNLISKKGINRILIICTLIIGFYTPLCELDRSLYNTFTMENNAYDKLYSMKDVLTKDDETLKSYNLTEKIIILDKTQYFSHQYKDSFFFKMLSKQGK